MPCYDPMDNRNSKEVFINGVDPQLVENEREHSKELIGVVCALLHELDKLGIAETVIATASRHGRINIMHLWEAHKADDKARLTAMLHRYSVDEQRVLKELLNKANI